MNARDEGALPPAAGIDYKGGLAPTPTSVEMPTACTGGGGAEAALNGAASARLDEPPKKRPKMDDTVALRKRILECKLVRLKSLRDRLTEQLSELYFLQAGGNMIDYTAWRKRPPAPQFLAFLEARRPPALAPPPPDPPPEAPPAPTPAPQPAPISAGDEVVEKAKQEAYVARRVAELARAGLWTERRLPKVMEPPRAKSHWDYLLEEMAWLAQDFAHERKWKKQAAKKCARAVQKYFQDKAMAAQKAEKAQELQLKKIAAFAAKEIRTFWSNVEKLVEWKRVRRVERARKEALDEQLSYIVDRTERYSRQLAANLTGANTSSAAPSDDEFEPRSDSDDDEETIAAAEREAPATPTERRREIEALRRESQLDLSALLPPGYRPPTAHSPPPSDYGPEDEDSADDENTIAAQEKHEKPEETEAEIAALQDEAELSIEELMKRYSRAPPPKSPSAQASTEDSTDASGNEGSDDEEDAKSTSSESTVSSESRPLESLVETSESSKDGEATERKVEACSSLAAALQPTGTTLADTAVGTPVPRLLRHSLREYQHVGLHWLATMHARQLNGILADEMGLGKTIQTIALLAHLALEHGDWGPHLVVAPTSVVLNWEMEFKKWCPSFKILTYYGTIKERKLKRVGWTKANSFHICITSYKLVVQDHQSFRRKRWKYLILDEAQNIKNFKSQRWQMLLNFQTERRLLLTGTPLQNSLLELWSLMHFLMPAVFASHSHFREWFADVAAAAEGAARNDALVRRLHEVLRPFLLRRLKADVERQMPRKYEHVLLCRLSKRQRFLYDDFMARAKTKESLASGNLLSVINVLMQLRKVCNHPDLFEPRPVVSPLQLEPLRLRVPALVLLDNELSETAARLGGDLATLEACGAGAFAAHRARHLAPPRRLIEELADKPIISPPRPPPSKLRLHLRMVPRAQPSATTPPPPPLALPSRPPPPEPTPAPAVATTQSAARLEARRRACLRRLASVNERRCWRLPLFGADLRAAVAAGPPPVPPKRIEDLLTEMHDEIDRWSVCWRAAVCGAPQLEAGGGARVWGAENARAWRRQAALLAATLLPVAGKAMALFHAPASRQAVAFPHPRLLQYDCGKLQTLSELLRRLKAGGHRVLIFTQMTRVLDVLEAFLSMHGHTYLRLDGATKVDARQPLVERFNADPRVFAMILSTRSGGVGLNLTGADTVVFYDSDWNPTMDAQAQDRAHRIGQTRDVHVYRLVTEATVEENILRKAEQKRALGHMAIEDGHFTTSYLRQANIKELFGGESDNKDNKEKEPKESTDAEETGGELESALAACEDEADAAAARAARAEHHKELAEFDETLPLDDDAPRRRDGEEKEDDEDADDLAALMKQLTPVEKYAMRIVESGEEANALERAALDDMRRQLREWEDKRRALRDQEPEGSMVEEEGKDEKQEKEVELTYEREDARAEVWTTGCPGVELMPIWCPPTPPQGEGDVYCESWSRALYRMGAAPESALPAVARRDPRAPREPRRRTLPRAAPAPPSLFERCGPRPRPRPRPPPHAAPRPDAPPTPDWAPCEDAALRRALRLQRLPMDPPAALAPNWDWVADLVNEAARRYRSPRQARDRHDTLADPERARRKHKKPPPARRRLDDDAPRPPIAKLDAMREAAERRRSQPKRRLDDAAHHNPKHAALLAEHGVDYETPPTPMEVATRRAERIAKEKMKAGTSSAAPAAPAPAATPPAAPPAATAPPQRIVVAAHATEAARRPRAPAPAGTTALPTTSEAPRVSTAGTLLYRQQAQALAARHHLKILHHASVPLAQSGANVVSTSVAGTSGEGVSGVSSGALRTLQLQQLALRRAGGGTGAATGRVGLAHSHVVVAHLQPQPAQPQTHSHNASQPHHHDDNHSQ